MNVIRKNGGFTLIELVVVIAILAVVGGIGTVGYSAYVDRANWSADQTMIHDIEQALILGTYTNNHAPNSTVGAVGVSKDAAATASDAAIAAMMVDAFGANWQETLQLKSDKLKGSDASNVLSAMNGVNGAYFNSVPNSSFYSTDGATEDLAAKVDEIASAFKGILGDQNGHKFANFWGDDFKTAVNDQGLDITNSQTAANLTVMAAASGIANATASQQTEWINSWVNGTNAKVNSTDKGYVAPLVMNYAKYVSLVSYVNDPANGCSDRDKNDINEAYGTLVSAMSNLSNNTGDGGYVQAFNNALNSFEAAAVTGQSYYDKWMSSGQAKTDAEAFIASMAAVNSLEGTYVNKDKADVLNQANAFTDFGAADILDTMVGYASLGSVPTGDWVITVVTDNNGVPQIAPELPEG